MQDWNPEYPKHFKRTKVLKQCNFGALDERFMTTGVEERGG